MRLKMLIISSLLFLACWSQVYAQDGDDLEFEPLILNGDQSEYPLGLYLELLEDPSGKLTIEDVTSPEYETRFSPSEDEVPNFGFTDSAYWVRLRLRNDSPEIERRLLELAYANMHFVDLYTPLSDGDGFEVRQTGALRPLETRDIAYPNILFDLTIPNQSEQTLYMRFLNGDSMTLPLTLWDPMAFLAQSQRRQLAEGVFLGIMLGLMAYNLFLFISIQEANYLYLVLLISGVIIFEMSHTSIIEVYVAPGLYAQKKILIIWADVLMFASLILFNDAFLRAKRLHPTIHRINMAMLGVWILLWLISFVTSYTFMANLIPPFVVITLIVAAVEVLFSSRHGFRPNRFLLIAWLGVIIGILLYVFTQMGFISNGVFTEYLYRIAFVWMAICWSLALADRINMLKTDAERANHELKDSQYRLSQTLEAMPLGVLVYGKDRKPSYMNKQVGNILNNPSQGIVPEVSAGRTLSEAMAYYSFRIAGTDQSYPMEDLPVHRAYQGETSSIDDIEADLVDRRAPLEIWASPVKNERGNIESVVVAFQDITVRKQSEMALRASEAHLRVIVENNFEGIIFMDRDRKIVYVSPSYTQLNGLSTEEMVEQSGVGFIHPDDRAHVADAFQELLQQPGGRVSAEYRIQHQDGLWVWLETNALNLLDDPHVQAVVLNSRNITERKLTETELAKYRKSLELLVEERTVELRDVEQVLQQRIEWLEAVTLINEIMARSADFSQIYENIIEIVNRLFRSDYSFIAELNKRKKQLQLLAHSCSIDFDFTLVDSIDLPADTILSHSDISQGSITILVKDELIFLGKQFAKHCKDSDIKTIVLVPLQLRDQTLGLLGLELQQEGRVLSPDETALLNIFSVDIARLIEDRHLFEQTKATITADERQRLARELHDSVTQTLFTASVLAEATPRLWDRDEEIGRQNMAKLSILIRGALAEMRSLLLELQSDEPQGKPLSQLLMTMVEAMQARSPLAFSSNEMEEFELPEKVTLAFYRIAREALNNVIIHARATHVAVSLFNDEQGGVLLQIQDDGCGFDPQEVPTGHMGIGIMRERMEEIGGDLWFESKSDRGTKVIVTWSYEGKKDE